MDLMKMICWAMLCGETKPSDIVLATGIGRHTASTYMSWARKADLDPDLARLLMNADSARRKRAKVQTRLCDRLPLAA